mmetsp:Transcript_10296/g.21631  ORF Transcript_10296/g.21631 Transcript_10296/m.21631 type:complete len:279 (+) Transcript_10296:81-917(+)
MDDKDTFACLIGRLHLQNNSAHVVLWTAALVVLKIPLREELVPAALAVIHPPVESMLCFPLLPVLIPSLSLRAHPSSWMHCGVRNRVVTHDLTFAGPHSSTRVACKCMASVFVHALLQLVLEELIAKRAMITRHSMFFPPMLHELVGTFHEQETLSTLFMHRVHVVIKLLLLLLDGVQERKRELLAKTTREPLCVLTTRNMCCLRRSWAKTTPAYFAPNLVHAEPGEGPSCLPKREPPLVLEQQLAELLVSLTSSKASQCGFSDGEKKQTPHVLDSKS